MLSLLVFFALFGVFITQYVPLWMSENENQFSNEAQASLETLKQYVDDQAIFGAPHTYAVPFTLSSDGIPLFAQPTQGSLSYLAGGCSQGFTSSGFPVDNRSCVYQRLTYELLSSPALGPNQTLTPQPITYASATNYLQMQLPNRYFPSQDLFFDSDAVIVSQAGGGQWMLVPPPLTISMNGPNTTVTGSFVTLLGSPSAYSSQGVKDVYSTSLSSTNVSSFGRFVLVTNGSNNTTLKQPLPFDVEFEVGTHNPCAWQGFLANLTGSSALRGLNYSLKQYPSAATSSCGNPLGRTSVVTLTVHDVTFAQAYIGQSELSFNVGGSS